MNRRVLVLEILLVVFGFVLAGFAVAQEMVPTDSGAAKLTVSPDVRAMANNPTPPASAKQSGIVGSDGGAMKTNNSADDTDSMWVQEIDVDGDGNVEKASLLWDDEDKVLFISYKDEFACKKGGMGSGAILIGLNGTGNARNVPVGSGFYTISLDKSECASQSAGLYGCKFDGNGVETACGMAVLDEKSDSLVFFTTPTQ